MRSNNPVDTTIAIQFAYGKYDLDTVATNTLIACYHRLIANDSVRYYMLSIDGFTDTVGTEEGNLKLSEKRAQRVDDYLHKLAGGPVIKKCAILHGRTECGAFSFIDTPEVQIGTSYFGKSQLKGIKIDSLKMTRERKVLLHFQVHHDLCDNFPGCELPTRNKVFSKDSTIKVFIPSGYSYSYTVLSCHDICRFDTATKYTLAITDTFIDKLSLCDLLLPYYTGGQKPKPIKIGSVTIQPFYNDSILPTSPCLRNFTETSYPLARLWVSSKLFPLKTSYITTDTNMMMLNPPINDSVVVLVPNTRAKKMQTINFYASPSTVNFQTETLVIKGRHNYGLYTKDPEAQCEIPYTITSTKRSLFSNYTVYTGIKFKQATPIYMFNNQTNKTLATRLSAFQRDARKAQYVLKRKALKKLERQQPKK